MYDAIALLKAQEAKVLTLQMSESEWREKVLYLEQNDKKNIEPCLLFGKQEKKMFGKTEQIIQFLLFGRSGVRGFTFSNCGKKWRCWTSRPTDAQREATPWEQ